jgi:hypothetical protein
MIRPRRRNVERLEFGRMRAVSRLIADDGVGLGNIGAMLGHVGDLQGRTPKHAGVLELNPIQMPSSA